MGPAADPSAASAAYTRVPLRSVRPVELDGDVGSAAGLEVGGGVLGVRRVVVGSLVAAVAGGGRRLRLLGLPLGIDLLGDHLMLLPEVALALASDD